MKVGFIGVGNMGGPMCRNIVKRSNHQVTVFDLNPAAVKACTDLGATAGKSIADLTKGADLVMTSLPMPRDVEKVALGEGGILASIKPGPDTFKRGIAALVWVAMTLINGDHARHSHRC